MGRDPRRGLHRGGAGSLAEVSFLLDPPAGKDGFIRIRNGHFVRGDGRRIRFWGVHLTDWSRGSILLPSHEDASMYAASLARSGTSICRVTGRSDSGHLRPAVRQQQNHVLVGRLALIVREQRRALGVWHDREDATPASVVFGVGIEDELIRALGVVPP